MCEDPVLCSDGTRAPPAPRGAELLRRQHAGRGHLAESAEKISRHALVGTPPPGARAAGQSGFATPAARGSTPQADASIHSTWGWSAWGGGAFVASVPRPLWLRIIPPVGTATVCVAVGRGTRTSRPVHTQPPARHRRHCHRLHMPVKSLIPHRLCPRASHLGGGSAKEAKCLTSPNCSFFSVATGQNNSGYRVWWV